MLTPKARAALEDISSQIAIVADFNEVDARSLMRTCELIYVSVSISGDPPDEAEEIRDTYTLSELEVLDGVRAYISKQHDLPLLNSAQLEAGELTGLRVVVPRDELKRLSERAEDIHACAHAHARADGGPNPWRDAYEKLKQDVQNTAKALK